mmetsp:Transcript_26321/g.66180  ORF Transcript_26321/g.66180 Transcript_26321/m.66180 type:complete len:401 (+) Transcript_26321:213-1415(+)|eukprot:CAMPEP_0177646602 /NCGR_PEP_ID=MMETSP0447-20121125/9857_1 /TAXON_ID=0 /ORGANISM="Stygamoeba regulata, Strain BSH-02190019" /LENGTH=400 /DNA_ID=CAMNT_0019149137 /DNA_START=217 /DNA_END=1419 /DNA_ORIENTATION=+
MEPSATFLISVEVPFTELFLSLAVVLPTEDPNQTSVIPTPAIQLFLGKPEDVMQRLVNINQSCTVVNCPSQFFDCPKSVNHYSPSPQYDELLELVHQGLEAGVRPTLCSEGIGGTYFLKSPSGETLGVYKPRDEEPGAINNPKSGMVPERSLPGDVPAETGYLRELAAYVLDKSFAGVPLTGLASLKFPEDELKGPSSPSLDNHVLRGSKFGSLQQFVPHLCNSDELGSGLFPVDNVHKIALLDVRVMNTDRHGGNMLVVKDKEAHNLVPIDHAFCLPESMSKPVWFEWMGWSQTKQPLSEVCKQYIRDLSADEDCKLLAGLGLTANARKSLRIGTLLLKLAVKHDLTMYDVGSFICSTGDEPSQLELLVEELHVYSKSGDDSLPSEFADRLESCLVKSN